MAGRNKDDLINPLMIPVISAAMSFCVACFFAAACFVLIAVAYGFGGYSWFAAATFFFFPRGPFVVFAVSFVALVCVGTWFWVEAAFFHRPQPPSETGT